MSNIFREEQVDNLSCQLNVGVKHVVFTRLATEEDVLNLCLCDGYDIFLTALDDAGIDEMVAEMDIPSKQSFFATFRSSFIRGEINVVPLSGNFSVTFGTGVSSIPVTLHPTTASKRKDMFHYIFFKLSADVEKFQDEAKDLRKQVSDIQKRDTFADEHRISSPFEPELKRNRPAKPRPKRGGSLINPGTRKKKAATGVVFDED